MKCSKCEKEVDSKSRFCGNCGEKLEERSSLIQLEDMTKTCAKFWYLAGFIKGSTSDTKKDKKILEDFEELLKKNDGEMWEWYKEVIEYWDKQSTQNNEKDKKADESKRAGISEIKRIKT